MVPLLGVGVIRTRTLAVLTRNRLVVHAYMYGRDSLLERLPRSLNPDKGILAWLQVGVFAGPPD